MADIIYNKFYIDALMPPTDCPDVTRLCNFKCDDGEIELELRVIKTPTVFGVVIDGIYLSLASGADYFKRGDYALAKDKDGKYWIGINENLYQ